MSPANSTTTWVRLQRDGVTVFGVERWPGPHHPGTVILTTAGGTFVFDHLDVTSDNGPEAVYRWTPT